MYIFLRCKCRKWNYEVGVKKSLEIVWKNKTGSLPFPCWTKNKMLQVGTGTIFTVNNKKMAGHVVTKGSVIK